MLTRFMALTAAPLILVGYVHFGGTGQTHGKDPSALLLTEIQRDSALGAAGEHACSVAYRPKQIRYWDAYSGHWALKTVNRPYRVCN